jgi:hypothetical protein
MGPEAGVLEPDPGELTGSDLAAGAGPVIRWLRNGATLAARLLHTAFGAPPATRSMAKAAAWLISALLRF